jgi:hydrogenase maturation protease
MPSTCSADIERELRGFIEGKTAVLLATGNPQRGDDGLAQLLFRRLDGKLHRLRILDCGTRPQDCVDKVIAMQPSAVIFVNAIDRSIEPGTIVLDVLGSTDSTSSSLIGHKVPLSWIALLLKIAGQQQNLSIETILIGVQIVSTHGAISSPVRRSVRALRKIFTEIDSVAAEYKCQATHAML